MIRRWMPIALLIVLATLALVARTQVIGMTASSPPPSATSPAIHFRSVDITVDPHGRPLAAYQVEIRVTRGDALIVGIEGGEHVAFHNPPYYDPAALQNRRIILAAFNTADARDLPAAKTRVARLHVQVRGDVPPQYAIRLDTAADAAGKPFAATVSLVEGEPR
jgi:hypothetical protein